MSTAADLAAVLRGDSASAADLRAALDGIRADGLVLVHRDVLAGIAAQSTVVDSTGFASCGSTESKARRLALMALLATDRDLLAEALVSCMWDDCHDLGRAAA